MIRSKKRHNILSAIFKGWAPPARLTHEQLDEGSGDMTATMAPRQADGGFSPYLIWQLIPEAISHLLCTGGYVRSCWGGHCELCGQASPVPTSLQGTGESKDFRQNKLHPSQSPPLAPAIILLIPLHVQAREKKRGLSVSHRKSFNSRLTGTSRNS